MLRGVLPGLAMIIGLAAAQPATGQPAPNPPTRAQPRPLQAATPLAASQPASPQPGLALLNEKLLAAGGDAAQAQYRRFLLVNLPRAFALSSDGKVGWRGGGGTPESVRESALASCTSRGGTDCALYADGLGVVMAGREVPPPPPPPAGPLLAGDGYAFIPDPRFIWWGPQRAHGLYVFGHGRSGVEQRGIQPQPHVRAFNNAGFDVVRFDREPAADVYKDRVAGWLRVGLRDLRARGWRLIVAGGQSRGAWNALQTLDTAGAADVVIAIAAASHGTNHSHQMLAGKAELYTMFRAAAAPQARVAIVQFKGDDFEREPEKRFALAREHLAPRVGALLLIDQPPEITGHGGGASHRFAVDFGACLLRFATDPVPPRSC